jgi:hypothetical protein
MGRAPHAVGGVPQREAGVGVLGFRRTNLLCTG